MGFYLIQYEMQSSTGTQNLKNQDTILNVTSGVLHFIGDSLVPETIDKNCLEGTNVLQQVDKKFIPIVANTTLAIIDQVYSGLCIVHHGLSWFLMNFLIMHLLKRLFLLGIVWLDSLANLNLGINFCINSITFVGRIRKSYILITMYHSVIHI